MSERRARRLFIQRGLADLVFDRRVAVLVAQNDNEGVLPVPYHHAGCWLPESSGWCEWCKWGG